MAAPLLQGLSALVTGAASGIGQHTALAFAEHGIARLALADIDVDTLDASVEALKRLWPQPEVLQLQMDICKPDEVRDGVAQAVARFGRLDIAVNNAGVSGIDLRTHETDEAEWLKVVDINLNGVFRCHKEELAVMMGQEDGGPRRGRGTIVNVASMYGIIGPPSPLCLSAYTTTKHGVVGLTRADANAYAHDKIRINAICPGYTATPLVLDRAGAPTRQAIQQHVSQRTPVKRMGTPEEIADSIVFLASPMSSFMHGAALVVDGGFSSS